VDYNFNFAVTRGPRESPNPKYSGTSEFWVGFGDEKFNVPNDYTNPTTNPKILTTLTLTPRTCMHRTGISMNKFVSLNSER